jgi:hypothetical protein
MSGWLRIKWAEIESASKGLPAAKKNMTDKVEGDRLVNTSSPEI